MIGLLMSVFVVDVAEGWWLAETCQGIDQGLCGMSGKRDVDSLSQ